MPAANLEYLEMLVTTSRVDDCGLSVAATPQIIPLISTRPLGRSGIMLSAEHVVSRVTMPIDTPEELREHIELAIKIELATIPPYLYAMYSLEDVQSVPALLIRSIVVEEMLHAALATNLLLAVGGRPDFRGTGYMATYPCDLPHHMPPLTLNLEPISVSLVRDTFMRIEQPEAHDAPAEPDDFETLGQFYHALEMGLEKVSIEFDVFADPQLESQLSDARFYAPVAFDAEDSGGLVGITDLASATEAIEIIVHQGEGLSEDRWADPAHQELTHYHKLVQIVDGEHPLGAVHGFPSNPRTADYPNDLGVVSDLFNAVYRGLFLTMDRTFSGDGDQARAVGVLYMLMADILVQIAGFLASVEPANGMKTAPTFEIYEFRTASPLEEVKALSEQAARMFPELSPVYEAIRGLSLIL